MEASAQTRSRAGLTERRLALVLVVLVFGILALIFWLARDVPTQYGCGEDPPPGNVARRVSKRRGGAARARGPGSGRVIVTLSWRRNLRRDEALNHPGYPTIAAAALTVLLTLAAVFDQDFGELVLAASLITSGIGFGMLVGAACLIVGAVTNGRASYWLTMAGLWHAVVAGVPLHALVVYIQGHGPILC